MEAILIIVLWGWFFLVMIGIGCVFIGIGWVFEGFKGGDDEWIPLLDRKKKAEIITRYKQGKHAAWRNMD